MNTYHKKLSEYNRCFRSKQAYRAIESYCETLIFLHVYRPADFVDYFDQEGVTYVPLDKKYWNTKRSQPEKKQ